MKEWLRVNKDRFYLGLSLDRTREIHNHNISNSFDLIDLNFFLNTFPNQNIKMTLSVDSLPTLTKDIKFIHSLGFGINGAKLSFGDFDWDGDDYIKVLVPQLKKLVDYYSFDRSFSITGLFDKYISVCSVKRIKNAYCLEFKDYL